MRPKAGLEFWERPPAALGPGERTRDEAMLVPETILAGQQVRVEQPRRPERQGDEQDAEVGLVGQRVVGTDVGHPPPRGEDRHHRSEGPPRILDMLQDVH